MSDQFRELMKEEKRIAEGRGPLETPAQRESDQHNDAGWKLHCQNRFKEAIEAYDTAIQLNPRHALAVDNKGLSFRRLERFDDAVQCFDDAIRIAPRFVKPYSNKGETLGMMGATEEAAEWFNKALEVEPGYPRAVEGLGMYCGACARKTESPEFTYLGWDMLEVAEIQLEQGRCVAVTFDFGAPGVPWEEVIDLTNRYPRFVVVDLLDRSEQDHHAMASRFQQLGALNLALDTTIRAVEKSRTSGDDS